MQSRAHATKLAKKSALLFRSQFGFVNLFQRAWFKYVVAAKNSCCLRRFGTAPFARICKSSSAWPCAHVACMIKSEMCATSSPLSEREAITSCRSSIAAAFWILLTEAWRGVPSTPARASLAAPRRRASCKEEVDIAGVVFEGALVAWARARGLTLKCCGDVWRFCVMHVRVQVHAETTTCRRIRLQRSCSASTCSDNAHAVTTIM